MVSKNKGHGQRGSSEKKTADRTTRRQRKPVTIDLEATASGKKSEADKAAEKAARPTTGKSAIPVPGVARKAVEKSSDPVKDVAKDATAKTAASRDDAAKKTAGVSASATAKETATKTASGNDVKGPSGKNAAAKTTPAKAAPAKASPANTAAVKPSTGSMSRILAGIIGGIVALAGAWLLQLVGILPSPGTNNAAISENLAKLDSRLAALSTKVDEAAKAEAPVKVDLRPLEKRLAEIEAVEKQRSAAAKKPSAVDKAQDGKISALAASVKTLEQTTDDLQKSISSGAAGKDAGLSALAERLARLEKAPKKTGDLDIVKKNMAQLASQIAAVSAAASSGKGMEETKAALAAISQKLATVEDRVSRGLGETGEKIAGIETGLKAVAGSVETVEGNVKTVENTLGEAAEKVNGLGERLSALETAVNTPRKDEQRVARAMAAAGLKTAIDSGRGFGDALALYEGLANDAEAVAALKAHADSGIPTISALKASFAPLADKMLQATSKKDDKSIMGKILNNARSLVKVKTIGVMEGDSPAAIVSRIEAGLDTADLGAVVKEWETLPEAAKAVSGNWIGQVKARVDADALLTNLLRQFMTGQTGTNN